MGISKGKYCVKQSSTQQLLGWVRNRQYFSSPHLRSYTVTSISCYVITSDPVPSNSALSVSHMFISSLFHLFYCLHCWFRGVSVIDQVWLPMQPLYFHTAPMHSKGVSGISGMEPMPQWVSFCCLSDWSALSLKPNDGIRQVHSSFYKRISGLPIHNYQMQIKHLN